MDVHQFVDGHLGLTVCSVVYPSLQDRIVGSQKCIGSALLDTQELAKWL